MKEEILKLNNLRKKASLGGGKEKVQAQHNKGKLTAIERKRVCYSYSDWAISRRVLYEIF